MVICSRLLNRLNKKANGNKIFIWYHPQKSRSLLKDVVEEATGM